MTDRFPLCRSIILSLLTAATLGAQAVPKASELHDPPGQSIAFKLQTLPTSVQIYTCKAGAWTGPDPDAVITDAGNSITIHHYKGPTWEATDGSLVRGSNARHWLAPREHSVDWLELTAGGGIGKFAKITYIHRIDTAGGVAPSQACDAAHDGQQVRVPYSATYLFYTAK